jgi:hypothetical protein
MAPCSKTRPFPPACVDDNSKSVPSCFYLPAASLMNLDVRRSIIIRNVLVIAAAPAVR